MRSCAIPNQGNDKGPVMIDKNDPLNAEALAFHAQGPGKFEINATKPLTSQRDLSLAYSPGVAAPVWKSPPTQMPHMIIRQKAMSLRSFQWHRCIRSW